MTYDFDQQIDRRGTYSYKWDQTEKLFGHKDILPLWVADMDFLSPPAVVEAITERAKQGIYGYTIRSEEYLDAITRWFTRRHGWKLDSSWLTDTPGIVPALSIAVQCFTDPGDAVILQSPVYYPFYDVIKMNDRKVANNPLLVQDGRYEMDFDHLEQLMKDGAKLLLLCNPHNPGGRVWSKEELTRLGELCLAYNVFVVSDEIHCDLVLEGSKHVPFGSISEEFADISITCLAPSKTFNLPGLQASFNVIRNPKIKRVFDQRVKTLSIHMVNFFGPIATVAAYNEGEQWLDDMLAYVKGNVDFAIEFIQEHIPELQPMRPDGTYLLWVDCRKLGLDVPELKDLMFNQAKVAFNDGSVFGENGQGFVRMNLACPRATLTEALTRFRDAIASLR